SAYGLHLHAATTVDGRDRRRLERVCRYLLRPPFAHEAIETLADGRVRVHLKSPSPARRSWAKMEAAAARGLTAEAWTCPSPLSLHDSGCAPRSASTCVTRPLRENMKNPAGLQRKASADKGLARPRDHCFQQ
ncbi:MAG: transposase, partial [Myxococcales bacterium]|nr:transposase [Myxococcales bacterium]